MGGKVERLHEVELVAEAHWHVTLVVLHRCIFHAHLLAALSILQGYCYLKGVVDVDFGRSVLVECSD